jgi:hypothetical protein
MTMRIYHPDSRIAIEPADSVGASETFEVFECEDAEVWIEGDSILISYFDDEGIVVLEGRGDEIGGWALTGRSRPRRGRLEPGRAAPGEFAGELEEHGERGRWSLRLGAPVACDSPEHDSPENGGTCPKNP